MVRRGWLENGPGPSDARGCDEFVRVDWPELIGLLAAELERVIDLHGNAAIFGGSYGWGSAGRFHHPQSQVHRFLNTIGGYVRSVNNYSTGASSVILPHVLGPDVDAVHGLTGWSVLAEHTTMIVAFGGLPTKNMKVAPGGITRHHGTVALRRIIDGGTTVVAVSPSRADCPDGPDVRWCPINPGTDVAMMLALAWVLITGHLHDVEFLSTRCVGYERLEAYLLGSEDGVPKTPEWAEGITGVAAGDVCALASQMAANRTLVSVTWSLQRARYGEQPPWAAIALAAVLGQIGMAGGGFGHGYGSMGDVGLPQRRNALPTLPQGHNPVDAFIPVARVADMLLKPGARFEYNGGVYRYPDARLVYWCGGNPFHHHQHISRLRRGMAMPDTVVVHDPFWTATARHADIVVPSATSFERSDIGASRNDPCLLAMHQICDPPGEAMTDYETFSELAAAMGVRPAFTEDASERDWLRRIYERWRGQVADQGADPPPFEQFWNTGRTELPDIPDDQVMLSDFARGVDVRRHQGPVPAVLAHVPPPTATSPPSPRTPGRPSSLLVKDRSNDMTTEDQVVFTSFEDIEHWRATGKAHALLDVRERGEYALGQIPGSCPLPRGLIEICLERMVPWKDVPLVLYSNGEHRSALAARTCLQLGYRDVRVLKDGIQQWSADGHSPAYGVNVIGKTFGEKLSVTDEVQQLTPDEVAALSEAGQTLVFDARTSSEYAKGHIPGAYNVPGGELIPTVFKAGLDRADRTAPIIVHCAGRTRSIVGAYLLRQAGFDNVFALRNGTMAWVMSGRELEAERRPWTGPDAGDAASAKSAEFAQNFVHGTHASCLPVSELLALKERHEPCYVIDVRMPEEYAAGHIPGAISCPAGQLANAVDEQIAVRDALLVCCSGTETRAKIGAGLLARIGYRRVAWLGGGLAEWDGPLETGAHLDDLSFSWPDVRTVDGEELSGVLRDGTGKLIDVRRSSEYALSHIPGSVWIPRGDLERRIGAHATLDDRIVLASDRELRSMLAARTLLDMGHRNVTVLEGGLNEWIASGRPTEEGLNGADVSLAEAKEDAELVARRPKLLERNRADMVRYLDWEERLGTELLANAEAGGAAYTGEDHG